MEARGILSALEMGAVVVWDPVDRPRFRVPRGVGGLIREDLGAAREVLRRAMDFRQQLIERSPAPLLVLPGTEMSESGCLSCGEDIPPSEFRCPICQAAAWIALELSAPPP